MSRADVQRLGCAEGRKLFIVDNEVYDVDTFYARHPGGESVLAEFFGRDASSAFDAVGHSLCARRVMRKFRVATLAAADRVGGGT